jgi:catechol 2,3-dioxygenase-like lactoylglutathione lyase family enzyme
LSAFGEAAVSKSFLGFDHIDLRVRSLAAVEKFYDGLLPKLGLTRKKYSHVDAGGEWHEPSDDKPYNAAEYYEELESGAAAFFIGVIEDDAMHPTATRVAFRVASRADLDVWERDLASIGAVRVEPSADMESYPALFFEDSAGTKLELCARRPHAGGQ